MQHWCCQSGNQHLSHDGIGFYSSTCTHNHCDIHFVAIEQDIILSGVFAFCHAVGIGAILYWLITYRNFSSTLQALRYCLVVCAVSVQVSVFSFSAPFVNIITCTTHNTHDTTGCLCSVNNPLYHSGNMVHSLPCQRMEQESSEVHNKTSGT